MKNKIVSLTAKEAYILWSVICWWNKESQQSNEPYISHSLKAKLYDAMTEKERRRFKNKFNNWEIARIVELGLEISKNHPEWIKN